MELPAFLIGRYFSNWEHGNVRFLCTADIEAYSLDEILALADEETSALWRNLNLGYTATQGDPRLRQEIATLYEGVEPDEVLTFSGGEEAIFVLCNVLLRRGDHVVVVWPAYQSLYEVPRALGAEITFVPLLPEAAWSLDRAALQTAVRSNTRAIVVNFPHAPTGYLPDRKTFADICCIAQEAGAYVFSDESFRFLEYDPADRLPAAVEQNERGISLGSLSKAFALAGLRVGWLVTHDRALLKSMLDFKDYTSVSNSATSELLALIGLRARNTVLKRSIDILTSNLAHLDRFFASRSELFTWVRPRAGTIAFPRLNAAITSEQFATQLLEQEGVLLLPGSVYEYPGQHFRIGFGRTDFPDALARLERFTAPPAAQGASQQQHMNLEADSSRLP